MRASMQVEMEVAWLVKEGKALMGFPTGGQALRPVAALGLLASLNLALLDKVDRPSVACAVVARFGGLPNPNLSLFSTT